MHPANSPHANPVKIISQQNLKKKNCFDKFLSQIEMIIRKVLSMRLGALVALVNKRREKIVVNEDASRRR